MAIGQAAGATMAAEPSRGWRSYENRLLATLSAAEASMFVDRLALGILTPFVVADLKLSTFQVGLLASVFSVTYALAGYVGGLASDRSGRRRAFLMMHVLAFSVLSAATGLSTTFAALLAIRFLLGLAEGPVLPLLQVVMIPASSPNRRAFNAAFMMNVAPFMVGQFAAPIVLTHLATIADWRVTFFLTGLPGLLVLPFIARLVRDPERAPPSPTAGPVDDVHPSLFRNRNVMLCVAMAACTGTWIWMFNTFLPLYLVRTGGFGSTGMGYLVSLLGVGGCIASLILPTLSDRIGRKPVLLTGFAMGALAPCVVLLATDTLPMLVIGIILGSCVLGLTPITITLVPADSVSSGQLARAIGLTSASSAIIGGMIMTVIAGRLSDTVGPQAPFVLSLAACICALLLAAQLRDGNDAASSRPT